VSQRRTALHPDTVDNVLFVHSNNWTELGVTNDYRHNKFCWLSMIFYLQHPEPVSFYRVACLKMSAVQFFACNSVFFCDIQVTLFYSSIINETGVRCSQLCCSCLSASESSNSTALYKYVVLTDLIPAGSLAVGDVINLSVESTQPVFAWVAGLWDYTSVTRCDR